MDKNEITHLSRSIGTYPISIQDFPDCCTVFQPSNPATRTFLPQLFQAEANIDDAGGLVAAAVNGCEIYDYSSMDTPLWRTETMASPSFV
jgi:thiamine biosynthesis protein ThiI